MSNFKLDIPVTVAASVVLLVVFSRLSLTFYCLIIAPLLYFAIDFLITKDPTNPWKPALRKYLFIQIAIIAGTFFTWKLRWDTRNIQSLQDEQLRKILQKNSDTEYYRQHRLDKVTHRDDYVKLHPLVKYDQFEPYIHRMMKGEKKVLTSEEPFYYSETSGTTGKPSRIPYIPILKKLALRFILVFFAHTGKVPEWRGYEKILRLFYHTKHNLSQTSEGVPIGPGSACKAFQNSTDRYCTPPAGYDIPDEQTSRYIHLLFGLKHRNLNRIDATFVSILYFGLLELEKEWRHLVKDIRNGTLKEGLKIPDEHRKELVKELKPDPQRADEVEAAFRNGIDNGLLKRIWPRLGLFGCISGGTFQHYADLIQEKYAADVPVFNPMYVASEGFIGLNIFPLEKPAGYIVWPYGVFVEFILFDHITDSQPPTLFMDQVKQGETYEIVLTNYMGLYRYRLGDLVRVVKFYGQCPVVEFLYRTGMLLNIRGEKVSEASLLNCMKLMVDELKPTIERIVDFTSCESSYLESINIELPFKNAVAPYYLIFMELQVNGDLTKDLEEKATNLLDDILWKNDEKYGFYRKGSGLDQLKVWLVKSGSFVRLRQFMLDNSTTSPDQIKLPKLLKKKSLIEFMFTQRI